MFNNAGRKIVYWAKVLFFAGVAVSLALGFVIIWRGSQVDTVRIAVARNTYLYNTGILSGSRFVIVGFLVMIFGSLASWLTALLLKAFGDMAVDTKAIRERLDWPPHHHYRPEPPMEPWHEHHGEAPVSPVNPEEPAEEEPPKPVHKRTRKPAAAKTEEPAEPAEE